MKVNCFAFYDYSNLKILARTSVKVARPNITSQGQIEVGNYWRSRKFEIQGQNGIFCNVITSSGLLLNAT